MSRYMTADDVSDAFADERRALAAEYEAEISELRAEVETLKGLLADANAAKERYAADAEHARQTLVEQVEHGREAFEPLRPIADVLHAELLRSDTVEHYPQGDDAPAMLKIGRATLFGIAADPLLEALRSACLDFTDDKE
jgi:hypothetical protein